jgi:hypothetical protein
MDPNLRTLMEWLVTEGYAERCGEGTIPVCDNGALDRNLREGAALRWAAEQQEGGK